ncbi:MAG: glycosyltransferase [Candidatus Bathyarchaeia archaeon]
MGGVISKTISIANNTGEPTVSIIVVFPKFPNKYVTLLLDSTSRLSIKYEVILVTDLIESEKDAEQSLLDMSKGKPNLTKVRLVLINTENDKEPAFGRNLGALLADSSILLFADDDTMVVDDINPLLQYLQTDKCQGLQPLLIRFAPEIVDSAGDFIKKVDRTRYTAYCRNAGVPLKILSNLQTDEVPSLRSAFMLVKKDAFLGVGGFDSTFIFNYEDVDLGWRMTCAGYKLLFIPHVKAKHKGSRAASNLISDRNLRLEMLNLHAMYLKIAPYSFWLYIFFAHFQRSLLRYELARTRQRKATYASAIKDLFTMNKLFIERVRQARLHRRILIRKFHLQGRQKLEDMAHGKRFIYQL